MDVNNSFLTNNLSKPWLQTSQKQLVYDHFYCFNIQMLLFNLQRIWSGGLGWSGCTVSTFKALEKKSHLFIKSI